MIRVRLVSCGKELKGWGVEVGATFAEFDHVLGGDPGRSEVGNTVPGCVDFGAGGCAVDTAVHVEE